MLSKGAYTILEVIKIYNFYHNSISFFYLNLAILFLKTNFYIIKGSIKALCLNQNMTAGKHLTSSKLNFILN